MAILILAAVISLNIYLDRKIAREAPGFITRFSEDSGYSIYITDIGIDPLFNLTVKGVHVKDPTTQGADVARIQKIVVDPGIISSLIERKLVVNQILAKNTEVWATKENIDNARAAISKFDKGKQQKAPAFEIRGLRFEQARYHISPETSLSSENFGVGIINGRAQPTNIDVFGDLIFKAKRFDIEGALASESGLISGFLDIVTKDLGSGSLKILNEQRELKAGARVNFEFSDIFRVYGTASVTPMDSFLSSVESVVNLDYDINYNPSSMTAALDKIDLQMDGFLEGGFSGKVDVKDGDVVLDISGGARAKDLSQIKNIIPALGDDEISGSADVRNLNLSGSVNNDSLNVKGDISIDNGAYGKAEDELKISGLNCALKLNQKLKPSEGLPLEPKGNCTADRFSWPKTGEAKGISSNIQLSAIENFSKANISLSELSGGFMEGVLTGSLGFDIGGGPLKISGFLTGNNLALKEAPKTIIPFDIEGLGETVSAKFEGGSGVYAAEISFSARDIVVGIGEGREFKLSKLRSLEDAGFSYKSEDQSDEGAPAYDSITIMSKGLGYEDLSYGEYLIDRGQVKELLFSLAIDSDWSLNLASQGSGFEVLGKDISLSSFKENLSIQKSGRSGFSGHVEGEGGKFKSIEFPALKWDYKYRNGYVELSALRADIGTIGRFETDDLNLSLGENESYPIVSKFKESVFTGLDKKVRTETLSGDITINAPDSGGEEWDGNMEADVIEVMEQPVSDIHIDVVPLEKGLRLKNISGTFLGGALSGNIDVDTTGPRARIVSDMELNKAVLNQDGLNVRIARTEFDFTGLLPQSSLPEGRGEVRSSGIVVTKDGTSFVYNAGLSGVTEGETLSIEKGFISDKESKELSFTGKMVDTLNEERTLRLNMPGIQVPTAISLLRPFMPKSLSEAKTRGQADLELVFYNLFYPGQTWGGKLGVLRGEYIGMLSGTELIVKDIYGTVTIKEDADSENPLGSYLKNGLNLSKTIYKKFLKSIKEFDASGDSDYLKIGSLQYGIIKIEDIDCSLEVDREELNLKRLSSKAFRGGLYGTGTYKFQDPGNFNISFLFDEISLKAISDRVSPNREYITGRVNGLAWITGEGGDLNTIDGPFMFWATNSPKEPRRVGQALLDRLGARERLILGSSRGYDRGVISGYINDGVLTFRELNISNSVLGFRNLNIQADPRQNSISINHLISVIRELARRSLTGGPTIETN